MDPDDDKPVSSAIERLLNQVREGLDEGVFSSSISTNIPTVFQRDDSINEPIETTSRLIRASDRSFSLNNDYNIDDEIANLEVSTSYHVPKKTPIDDDARISSSIHQPRYTLERDDSIRIPVNIQTKVLRVSDRSFSTHSDDTPVVPTKKLGGIEEFSSNVTIPRSVQLRREDSIRKPTKVSFKLVKSSADSLVEDNAQESSRHDEKDVQETESEKNLDNDSIVTTSDKLFNIKESEPSQADPAPNVEEFIEQKVVEQEETSCHEGEGTGLKRTNTLVILEVIDTPEEAQGAIFDKDDAIVDLDDTEEGILKIKSRRTTNNTTESDDDMRKQLEQIIIENLPEVFETDEMTGPAGEENVDVSADFVNDDVSLSSESEDLLSMSKIQQWKDVDLISLRSLKSLVAEVGIMAETFPTETNDVELDVSLEAIHENTSVENVSGTSNDVTYFRIGDDSETVDETVIYIVKKETEEEILSAPEETSIEQQNRDDTSCTGPSVEKDDFNPVEASKEEHFETLRNDTTVQQEEVIDKQYIIPEENEHFAQEKNNEDIEEPVVRRLESETPSAEILDYAESLSQEVMRNVAAQFPPQETPILDDKERTPIFRPITPLENGVSIVESDDGDFQPIRKLSAAETLQKVLHTIPAPATEDFPYETGEVVEEDMIMDSVSESLKDEDEGLDSIGEISEIQRFHQSFDSDLTRRDSFSSISSFGTRQQFRTAIDNIRSGLLPFASSASQYIEPESTLLTMASQDIQDTPPADNSQHFFEGPESPKQDSSDGSMDSSGFEKVGDEEILSEYSNRFAKQMEQSLYGGLPEDVEKSIEDDFLLVTDSSTIPTTSSSTPKLAVRYSELKRKLMASQHHDDVQEKNYFDTAKILESPISEEARKLVQDAVESASDYAQTAPVLDDVQDEIAAELDKNTKAAGDLIGDVVEKVNDEVPQKDHDDLLSDFVEKPQDTGAAVSSFLEEKAADAHGAVSDFVHETTDATKNLLEDSSNTASAAVDDLVDFGNDIARKIPEDIAEKTDNVHEEVDSFLSQAHRDSSPTEQQVPLTRSLGDFEEEPDFGRQTPESEETTFDRKGPLTIPEVPEEDDTKNLPDLTDFEAVKPYDHGSASHHGFETVPRPPTPPKDISDEDVKPSLVNLGPSPSHAHHDPHHSILKHKGEPWFDFKTVDPEVLDLIYWRDSKKSAAALSLILIAFFVLAKYPILSVLSYTGLAVLAATLGFRVFKLVEAQIKKTGGENPFQSLLAEEVTVPQEKVHAQVDVLVEHGTYLANQLKRLVLVESITDSVKFGLLLWSLTHISSWFSGFTIIFLAILGVFSIPKTYETYQEPIDAQLAVLQSHLQNVQNIVEEKLPFLRRPVAAEEKKDQ